MMNENPIWGVEVCDTDIGGMKVKTVRLLDVWDFSWDWPCCGCEEPTGPQFIVHPGDVDAEDWGTCDCGCHDDEVREAYEAGELL